MTSRTIVNVLIVLGLAALITALPAGQAGAVVLRHLLSTIVLALLVFAAALFYRSRQQALWTMPDGDRALLYGALAWIVLLLAGRERLADQTLGVLVLLLGFLAAAVAILTVIRHARAA